MARQTTTPVNFTLSTRKDTCVTMSSGRAGDVVPVMWAPLLPGDSASGRLGIDLQLAEMPKPLLNAVFANVQAWFVPKSAHPKFSGPDEVRHSFTGEVIHALGQADRTPPPYFNGTANGGGVMASGAIFKTLGIHIPADASVNTDLVDAYNLVWNFRAAAHSSKLTRRKYHTEDAAAANALAPAFWTSARFAHAVPDYERALIVGSLDLDVLAGSLPISGIGFAGSAQLATSGLAVRGATPAQDFTTDALDSTFAVSGANSAIMRATGAAAASLRPQIYAEMAGQSLSITLADIDKARTTQAFAKLRTAYQGNDATGFDNDDAIVSLLMRGISVPEDQFKRPWLLDSARVPVGFAERAATDGASLDKSVTTGRMSAQLSLNVPQTDVGGIIVVTVEVLPERVDERMSDEFLHATTVDHLPNALRDIQRIEPVDIVLNRRVDAKHSAPSGGYAFEPMNKKWDRDFTRLGGVFYQATPGAGWTENRSAIWQTEIVNPTFSASHYLAPQPFPHDVFSDQNGQAFEFVCRHMLTITGLTQIGDPLAEASDDYASVLDGNG